MTNGQAKKLKPHPYANLLPLMSEIERADLEADMAANGQCDPGILYEGKILDGRNRYDICRKLGTEFKTRVFKGSADQAFALVRSKAQHRHLDQTQKACVAARSAQMRSGVVNGKSAVLAGDFYNVSPRYVELARELLKQDEELFDECFNGKRTITAAMQTLRTRHRRNGVQKLPRADLTYCTLVHGDVVAKLEELPSKSVRIIFTDPPYNIGKKYHADPHGDARSDNDFLAWCRLWLVELVRVLADDGSLFLMINGPYAAPIEMILRELGLHRRNTIYWWENNPENQKGNFSDAVRPIHYYVKSRKNFVWNDDAVRVDSRRNQIGDTRALDVGKIPDNVWIDCRIPGNSKDRVPFADAPPQLPVAIPERCILVASEERDVVLDPFNGNGTTGIAALLTGRQYIGIDRSRKYLNQSRKWIAAQLATKEAASGKR